MSRKRLDEGMFKKPGETKAMPAANPADADRRDKALNFYCPIYVHKQIKAKAYEGETTVRAVILRAFAAAGFQIHPEDLEDRRLRAGDGADS